MTRIGRFKMAVVFGALSTVYIYGATQAHGTADLLAQLWGAGGFIIISAVFARKTLNTN